MSLHLPSSPASKGAPGLEGKHEVDEAVGGAQGGQETVCTKTQEGTGADLPPVLTSSYRPSHKPVSNSEGICYHRRPVPSAAGVLQSGRCDQWLHQHLPGLQQDQVTSLTAQTQFMTPYPPKEAGLAR